MLINNLQEIYPLRYDQHHKQTIKHLLQMVNTRQSKISNNFQCLKTFKRGVYHNQTISSTSFNNAYHISKVNIINC